MHSIRLRASTSTQRCCRGHHCRRSWSEPPLPLSEAPSPGCATLLQSSATPAARCRLRRSGLHRRPPILRPGAADAPAKPLLFFPYARRGTSSEVEDDDFPQNTLHFLSFIRFAMGLMNVMDHRLMS
ncbi:hypothetical protein U9M48_031325 [Paspalum notatum var. saurae]|uniref:Uncharacterized protein n=1 Tax=Paspalum notatum var. saurae TaxID=547442 RepID=A0AAQ3U6N3_PASNO